jgi:copper transport protein
MTYRYLDSTTQKDPRRYRRKALASFLSLVTIRRYFLVALALPLALILTLIFPATASAHAILLRSDPAQDSVLSIPPQQVRMWFSEDLNSTFTTADVINGARERVDNHDAHISPNDTKEMDLTLKLNLPPAVYIVVYRTQSAADGHILTGSFIFSVARPDGTVPTLSPGTNPGQGLLGGSNFTTSSTGQLDGPTLFSLIMITLVELGAVFWVAAQLWVNFVLSLSSEQHAEERSINERVQQRFERRFSLPALLMLLLANIGVLVGQAINITGGNWAGAFSPSLLASLATSGRFGTYWLMRELVIIVAIILSLYMLWRKQRPQLVNRLLPLINLFLGLALFIAITMSGHAAAASSNILVYSILVDWIHLVAAALWVGGMMYIATIYLPVLGKYSLVERTRSLLTILPYFSPLAVAGVLLMAVTGPFSATFRLNSWDQFLTTTYGRALLVKIMLVGGLLLTSAIHVSLLRPRLRKEYKKYNYVVQRLQSHQAATVALNSVVKLDGQQASITTEESDHTTKNIAQQVKLRQERVARRTRRLMTILRWEPLLGVAVLVCAGLLNVFGGTLLPATAAQPQTGGQSKPFNTSVRTTDGKFTATLNINPNRFGTNVFTVSVVDNSTHAATTNVGVALYTTMLDMDMGTDNINLLPDGKGHFTATGDLSMGGHWAIRIQIRTPDDTLHEANVDFFTPI